MTTDPDDMVTVPRELAERLHEAEGRKVWTPEGRKTWEELDAILNPPLEFDPQMVSAIAREWYLQAPYDDISYESLTAGQRSGHESYVASILAAARDAGWEMVEAAELEALRYLVSLTYDGKDGSTGSRRDAIHKARAARR